jgi:hypothetical protein
MKLLDATTPFSNDVVKSAQHGPGPGEKTIYTNPIMNFDLN